MIQNQEPNKLTHLVRPLFEGPIDIVGDVHGEIDALRALLGHLGYSKDGSHPEGRRLVFLGDLTDRGPDSPGVIDLVQSFVEAGHAQCVLGNHDLNILLKHVKHDNHWFFGEEWSLDGSDEPTPAVLADDGVRQTVINFFQTLPLVLERDDVRVVHACWDDSMVEIVRQSSNVVTLYRQYKDQIDADHSRQPQLDELTKELEHQNRNPVKVLTSGKERRVESPFYASGKWRQTERVPWWDEYQDETYCVFGHYSFYKDQTELAGRALCADFSVAKRWEERKSSDFDSVFRGKLAAVRFPEMLLMFDDGVTLGVKT